MGAPERGLLLVVVPVRSVRLPGYTAFDAGALCSCLILS